MTDNVPPADGLENEAVEKIQAAYGLTAGQIQALPEKRLAWVLQKLETPSRPGARMQYELDSLRDDQGEIEKESILKALDQLQEMRMDSASLSHEVAGMPSGTAVFSVDARIMALAGLSADNTGWTALGPGNIGGRTRAIVIDPTNTNRIYASGVGGGVWFSANAGQNWSPTDDLMANLAVCSLVMDPTNSTTLYAGTGEGFIAGIGNSIRGAGIFKTTDGGLNWTHLEQTKSNSDFFFVNSMAISNDGQTILSATTTGIFRSTDGGATWSQVFNNGAVGAVAFNPADADRAIAAGISRDPTTGGNAFHSADGGATWQPATLPTTSNGRVQLCYAAANPQVVYASVEANPSQLWRSTDGGQTYSRRNAQKGGVPANFLGTQGWYDNVVWAGSTTDANLVIVGGVDLFRSTDGGNNFDQISTWWADQSAHADHHFIVADPGFDGVNNRRVYFGNDGGVYRAEDVTTVGNNATEPFINGWENLNNGYGVTQFYYGDGHVATNTIMGGAQDNGTLRYTPVQGMDKWNQVWGGDGGDVASDPSDSQVWYGEYIYLQIFRDTSGGTAADIGNDYICGRFWSNGWRWKPEPFTITDARNSKALFIAPFELDPNEPNRLLGGALSLWRTDDAKTPNSNVPPDGPSWAAIKPPAGNDRRRHSISAIAIADGNSDIVVVGHANGQIFRSTDATEGTPNWQRIDNNGIDAARQCLALTIDPDDHDVIYATFGGFQSGNLWRTSDGGQSWTDLSDNLPDAPIRDVTVHPQRSTWIYVATQLGVFASEDGGLTWSPTNEGPANVACRDFFWMKTKLICVTHGRGMFEIDLPIPNAFPDPLLVFTGSEDVVIQGNDFTRYRLSISNRDVYPDSLFRPSPDLQPCGQNPNASRTWVDIFNGTNHQRINGFCALSSADDLDNLWFALPKGDSAPSDVYVVLRDRRCEASYRSNSVDISFGTCLNINSATAQEFEALPGIGPELAQRIVDHRGQQGDFAAVEDITNVPGIGPGRLQEIQPLITAS